VRTIVKPGAAVRLRPTRQRWQMLAVACIVKLSVLAFVVVAHGTPEPAPAAHGAEATRAVAAR